MAERFLAARRAAGYTLYLSPKALVPLLGYMRRLGAAPRAPSPVPAGPADVLLDRYRHYLVTERGVGTETAADYAKVGPFLAADGVQVCQPDVKVREPRLVTIGSAVTDRCQ